MTLNIADLQHDLEPLADHLADINAQIKALEAEADAIKTKIRERVETAGPGTYGAGAHTVTVSLNRRFNEARALRSLPEAIVPFVTFTETRIDKAKLRALDEDAFEAAHDVHEPRITVKEAK